MTTISTQEGVVISYLYDRRVYTSTHIPTAAEIRQAIAADPAGILRNVDLSNGLVDQVAARLRRDNFAVTSRALGLGVRRFDDAAAYTGTRSAVPELVRGSFDNASGLFSAEESSYINQWLDRLYVNAAITLITSMPPVVNQNITAAQTLLNWSRRAREAMTPPIAGLEASTSQAWVEYGESVKRSGLASAGPVPSTKLVKPSSSDMNVLEETEMLFSDDGKRATANLILAEAANRVGSILQGAGRVSEAHDYFALALEAASSSYSLFKSSGSAVAASRSWPALWEAQQNLRPSNSSVAKLKIDPAKPTVVLVDFNGTVGDMKTAFRLFDELQADEGVDRFFLFGGFPAEYADPKVWGHDARFLESIMRETRGSGNSIDDLKTRFSKFGGDVTPAKYVHRSQDNKEPTVAKIMEVLASVGLAPGQANIIVLDDEPAYLEKSLSRAGIPPDYAQVFALSRPGKSAGGRVTEASSVFEDWQQTSRWIGLAQKGMQLDLSAEVQAEQKALRLAQSPFRNVNVQLLSTGNFAIKPWANGRGTTTEMRVYPEGSQYPKSFGYRISSAPVLENGDFSSLPGVDRHLVVLEGGDLTVTHTPKAGKKSSYTLRPYKVHSFSGDDATHGAITAPLRDFNVMVNRDSGIVAGMNVVSHGEEGSLESRADRHIAIYAAKGSTRVTLGDAIEHLVEQGQLLLLENLPEIDDRILVRVHHTDGKAIVTTFDHAAESLAVPGGNPAVNLQGVAGRASQTARQGVLTRHGTLGTHRSARYQISRSPALNIARARA